MDLPKQIILRDQVLSVLKLRLISGDLAPGEIYSAASVAVELGVSNSPVREAMLTLVNQGLMETVRNRGFRVLPCSPQELQNIYEIRLMLEVPAMVRLAGSGAAISHRKRFAAITQEIAKAAKADDVLAFLEADRRFHIGLLELLKNEQLTAIIENLRDQSRTYGLKALADGGMTMAYSREYRPILDAIIDGDAVKTAELMTVHLSHIRNEWNAL